MPPIAFRVLLKKRLVWYLLLAFNEREDWIISQFVSNGRIEERARIRGRDEDVSGSGNSFHQLYRRRAGQ